MRVLVVGSGGREHALAWRIAESPGTQIVCAPGNPGTAAFAKNAPVKADDTMALVGLARQESVDLVVVGPEAPLVAGLVDALDAAGIRAFGPGRDAARLEGSKAFSKRFMAAHGIPTAAFEVFEDDPEGAEKYVRGRRERVVVKADGLAAGKGVVVAADRDEALAAIQAIARDRTFGEAGRTLVIEDCLEGEEVSYHVVSDGERWIPFAAAQDHKRLGDGDRGPNTGGMGAYSPPPVVTPELERKIHERIVEPTLRGMRADGHPFRGALFVGLMIVGGEPYVLEYNVRFGDPETEAMMARLHGDVLALLDGVARGGVHNNVQFHVPASLCVVLAAGGYPGTVQQGVPIRGLDAAAAVPDTKVFHAGTAEKGGEIVTAGGRVLVVTGWGASVDAAAARAYEAADRIEFEGKQLRRDIGWRARGQGV